MTPSSKTAPQATPPPPSQGNKFGSPEQQIAVSFFTTLIYVALGGMVLGFPFWVQKGPTTALLAMLAVGNFVARRFAVAGQHRGAMHAVGALTTMLAVPLMIFSVHMTAPTLMMLTIMPAYAAVCGRRPAIVLGVVYVGAAIAMHVAERIGIEIPKPFPTPHAAEVATTIIAMAGVLGPLTLVFRRLTETAKSLASENQQRSLAELHLTRAVRALTTISRCNKLLARADDEEQLMQDFCKLAVELGGYRMAWVGFAEIDSTRQVRPMASHGDGLDYLDGAAISWADTERGRGPTGTSIRESRTVVARNIAEDPAFAPWRDAALARNFQASIALPLRDESNRCFGCLTLYSAEPDAFQGEEVALLEELADDLAFGIKMMWVRAARDAAETTSRYNEALARAIVDQAPYAIELTDPQTLQFIQVNDAACRLLGYPKEEHQVQKLSDIQAEMSPAQVSAMTRQIIKDGIANFETRHRRKDGSLIDVWVSVRHLQLEGHDYLLAIWRDITAEKAAQAELRKLSLVVAQSPNPVVITDLDTRIEYVNEAFVHLSGFSRDQAIGQTPRLLKSGQTPETTYREMWETLLAGKTWRGEFINRIADGKIRVESAVIAPLRQPDGAITHYVAIKEDVTARKTQEDQLRKLSLAVEQSPESIVITNIDGGIEYVNDAFLRVTGYERQEVLGRNPRVLKSGKTDPTTYDEMWATLMAGKPWRGELINRRKDGSEYVEVANIAPVRGGDGHVTHYVAIKEDITEKKAMSDELDRHRQHLEDLVATRSAELNALYQEQRAIFESATAGIVLLRDRTIVRCNERLDQILGYAPGEQTGRSTRIWYADDDSYQRAGQEIYTQVAAVGTFTTELELARKDGSRLWVRASSSRVGGSDGADGMVVIIEDIAAERAAAEALRLASDEQRAIFDTASSGIALIQERVILRGNRRLHEMFGWPPGEMIGKRTAIWYPDEGGNVAGGDPVYAQIWRGEVSRRDQQLMRRDGSLFWARLSGVAVDKGDRSKGTVWVIEDITAERDAIERMREAKALAEEAVRMKSDFLANMSHEIRTPMNAIIGMSHLALRTELTPRQRDYLGKIQDSGQHLLGIINDILDLSKIEAGKMVVENIDFDLDQVLENVGTLVSEKAAAKRLELIIDVDPAVPRKLVGDPLRIGQILINYANNAVKFTEKGEILIRVAVAEHVAGGMLLRFVVTDTGIGIDAESRDRLFRSFEQADTSTTRKYGGTGLGLAIARQLAELMRGEVGVESEPGKGSSFWFTARVNTSATPAEIRLPSPDLRGRRMLVVDDNAHAREVLASMLASLRFDVDTAVGGEEALAAARRAAALGTPYDVIFVDWQMPGMDGLALARAVRAEFPAPSPRLLMVTAFGREDVTEPAIAAGVAQVITKPVTSSSLFEAVIRTFGRDTSRQDAGAASVQPAAVPGIAGARVLLVEDNDLNLEVASELLQDLGLVVEAAGNGAEAVAMVEQQPAGGNYDLVLMDVQMPVMDGFEATRRIRKLPGCTALPIVAMTANAMAGDREACITAGMNDHVPKPIDPELLLASLQRWIKHEAASTLPHGTDRLSGPGSVPPIVGIDARAGMLNALGRESLYLSLLRKFAAGQREFPQRIRSALAAEDHRTAERLAHTLKGVSAQIGAKALQISAEELEQLLRKDAGQERYAPLLDALCNDLAALLDRIEAALPGPTEPTADDAPSGAEVARICRRLAGQLAADDFASGETLETNRETLRSALGADYEPIAAAIESFDYGPALERLRQAMARIDGAAA